METNARLKDEGKNEELWIRLLELDVRNEKETKEWSCINQFQDKVNRLQSATAGGGNSAAAIDQRKV